MRWMVLLAAAAAGCRAPQPARSPNVGGGMGNAHHRIETTSPEAQRHFDLGLDALYAFNYDEAWFEFSLATRSDPSCAMCAWGLAMASGPNINEPDKQHPGAHLAAMRAVSLAKTPVERALAEAVMVRSPATPAMGPERDKLDELYATKLRSLAAQVPDDDIQVLLAEAEWLVMPRDLTNWNKDGTPRAAPILAARAALERVLERSPDHVGAIHFYIHVMDDGPDPARAIPYAEKLARLSPRAGHLLHMPSHLYLKVGRYADAVAANRAAMAADTSYLDASAPGGAYEMFAMHPQHFLWHVLLWEGVHGEARTQATGLANRHSMGNPMAADGAASFGPLTMARFGRWDEALALPAPVGTFSAITTHFARGLAHVAKQDLDKATVELAALRAAMTTFPPPPDAPIPPEMLAKINGLIGSLIAAAAAQLEGSIAVARKDPNALAILREAVKLEAAIPAEGEPPMWPLPARQRLGAALLAAGEHQEAIAVYRADLVEHPHNGWSLFGLATALDATKSPEAKDTWRQFHEAWKRSDVVLRASVF